MIKQKIIRSITDLVFIFLVLFILFYFFNYKYPKKFNQYYNSLFSTSEKGQLKAQHNVFYKYLIWWKNVLCLNLGTSIYKCQKVNDLIGQGLPKTLIFLSLSLIFISLSSLLLSFYIYYSTHNRIKEVLNNILETLSSIPEYIFSFIILLIFAYKLFVFPPNVDILFYDHINSFHSYFKISNWFRLLYYLFLPVLAVSFANGNISTLTNNLLQNIKDVNKKEYINFFRANGLSKIRLKIFVFKELLTPLFSYLQVKMPFIVGSAIIIEKIFNLKGIGFLAIESFNTGDFGVILSILLIMLLLNIIIKTILSFFQYKFSPILQKEVL